MAKGNRHGRQGQNGGGRRPVDSETRQLIVRLAREGLSQTKVATEAGVSRSTVKRVCEEDAPDVTWDRSAVAAAVEAHAIDMKAWRQEEAAHLLVDMRRTRQSLFGTKMERTHYSVSNGLQRWEAAATPSEMKDLAIAFGILTDKHMALARFDSDDRELPALDQWLGALGIPVTITSTTVTEEATP